MGFGFTENAGEPARRPRSLNHPAISLTLIGRTASHHGRPFLPKCACPCHIIPQNEAHILLGRNRGGKTLLRNGAYLSACGKRFWRRPAPLIDEFAAAHARWLEAYRSAGLLWTKANHEIFRARSLVRTFHRGPPPPPQSWDRLYLQVPPPCCIHEFPPADRTLLTGDHRAKRVGRMQTKRPSAQVTWGEL